ncbi:hypothetical protein C3L33_17557, partial [Rhododendron williamsianum]
MQADEGTISMEVEKVLPEPKPAAFPSKPSFKPLKAHEISEGKVQFRKVSVPPHRYTPLKKVWMEIYTPIYEQMKIDIRMNLKARKVELKTRQETPDISNLQKCADFVHAFMLGFDVVDAIALLRMDELYVESFEIKENEISLAEAHFVVEPKFMVGDVESYPDHEIVRFSDEHNKNPPSQLSNNEANKNQKTQVFVEGYYIEAAADGEEDNNLMRTKSLTEVDLDELKGCLDLGFLDDHQKLPGRRRWRREWSPIGGSLVQVTIQKMSKRGSNIGHRQWHARSNCAVSEKKLSLGD